MAVSSSQGTAGNIDHHFGLGVAFLIGGEAWYFNTRVSNIDVVLRNDVFVLAALPVPTPVRFFPTDQTKSQHGDARMVGLFFAVGILLNFTCLTVSMGGSANGGVEHSSCLDLVCVVAVTMLFCGCSATHYGIDNDMTVGISICIAHVRYSLFNCLRLRRQK
jgi:hypothetical protein